MELLFREDQNQYHGPASYNHNPFEYYEISARKDIEVVRKELNRWFSNYPIEHRKELKNSFKKHFYDSFYELFLHQLFLQLGFQIEIHPSIKNSNKRPDFLISKNDLEIYIEAKVVTGKSKEEEANERKKNEVLDNLNKIKSKEFFLHISKFEFNSNKQPRIKEIVQFVEEQLKNVNADEVEEILKSSGLAQLPSIQISNNDIDLVLGLIPKKKSARNDYKRPIGILPSESFWGGGEQKLREAIELKAKRYGRIDKPFIVCINSLDKKTTDKLDIDSAIWGAKGISKNKTFKSFDEKLNQFSDSIFVKNKTPRLTYLNGILINQVYPTSVPNSKYYLYENPFSGDGFKLEKLGLEFNSSKTDFRNDVIGSDLNQIFDLSQEWLNV